MEKHPLIDRHHFESIESTNDWAKANIKNFDYNHVTLITADFQTKGRGRFGKTWQAPPKVNILATYLFFTSIDCDQALVVSLMARACQEVLKNKGITSEIKWPNDMLVKGKKIAGILCEMIPYENKTAIITGIGLNVNMTQSECGQIDQPCTSFKEQLKSTFNLEIIINDLSKAFLKQIKSYL